MPILFNYPGYESVANKLIESLNYQRGEVKFHNFPDGESLVTIKSDIKDREVILLCGLDDPDSKIMSVIFFANLAKELGAKKVGLIAPYLGYMRQDKRFENGQAITSKIFAELLSKQIDWLVTIDPHLHRYNSLSEIYSIKAQSLHSINAISAWINNNIKNPLLIGPDAESEQWTANTAAIINAPFIILSKTRYGDKDVKVSMPEIDQFKNYTPIIIDDIISTGRTMIETAQNLQKLGMQLPICIAVHALFAGNAYENLKKHFKIVVTCNTVTHISNAIDISEIIADYLS